MKKVLILVLLLISLSSTTTSCSCDDDGEGGNTFLLSERGKSFLPYQINDTIKLVNSITNDTLILTVREIEDNLVTDEDDNPSLMGGPQCSGGSSPNTLEERLIILQGEQDCSFTMLLGPTDNFTLWTSSFRCPLSFEASFFPEPIPSITFNGISYTDLLKVTSNSLEEEIYYAAGIGLVAIIDQNAQYYRIP